MATTRNKTDATIEAVLNPNLFYINGVSSQYRPNIVICLYFAPLHSRSPVKTSMLSHIGVDLNDIRFRWIMLVSNDRLGKIETPHGNW